MSKLDEILDWYTRPVNKQEFLSTRKNAIKELFLELVKDAGGAVDHDNRHTIYGFDLLNSQLRKKIEEL